MVSPSQPSFSESLERAERSHQWELWNAAATVRARVAAEDGLADMLDCLGLADVVRPDVPERSLQAR